MTVFQCEDGTVILWVDAQSLAVEPVLDLGRQKIGVTLNDEALRWLQENAQGRVSEVRLTDSTALQFYDPNDALAFRMRWS